MLPNRRDVAGARASISRFLEQVCNQKLQAALGYLPPEEFDEALTPVRGTTPRLSPNAAPVLEREYEFSEAWGNLSPDKLVRE